MTTYAIGQDQVYQLDPAVQPLGTLDAGPGFDVAYINEYFVQYNEFIDVVISGATVSIYTDEYDPVTLLNFERIHFLNATVALDRDGNAGQAYRLYQAAFARTPDDEGLSYWIDQLDAGMSLREAALGFVASDEFLSVYGYGVSNEVFVERLYHNILGRDAEPQGIAFWVDELASGRKDTAQVLADVSESPENVARVSPAIDGGIILFG